MPDNKVAGMIEDFASFLIPDGDNLWVRATNCVQQIPKEERRFRETYQMKALLHTWLAWQEEPGTPIGLAITRRYLDTNAPHAHLLMRWIRRLFKLEMTNS